MYALKNKVQLIGTVVDTPYRHLSVYSNTEVITFKLRTIEKHEKDFQTHTLEASNEKVKELIKEYVKENMEIAIGGKLKYHNDKAYIEIIEILIIS